MYPSELGITALVVIAFKTGTAVSGTSLAATASLDTVAASVASVDTTSFLHEDKAISETAARLNSWFLTFMDDELLDRKKLR